MPGKIVETPEGRGKTDNNDKPFGQKILVYLDSGKKIVVDPKKIKFVGFWD